MQEGHWPHASSQVAATRGFVSEKLQPTQATGSWRSSSAPTSTSSSSCPSAGSSNAHWRRSVEIADWLAISNVAPERRLHRPRDEPHYIVGAVSQLHGSCDRCP